LSFNHFKITCKLLLNSFVYLWLDKLFPVFVEVKYIFLLLYIIKYFFHVNIGFFRSNKESDSMICFEVDQSISIRTDIFENEHVIVSFIDVKSFIVIEISLFLLFHLDLFLQFCCIEWFSDFNSIIPIYIL